MDRNSKVYSMLVILREGTGHGAPAGLTGPLADFQPRRWASMLWHNLSNQLFHFPKGECSRPWGSLSHCEVTNYRLVEYCPPSYSLILYQCDQYVESRTPGI